MRSYGQFCLIAKAAELFCERWTALVIRNLAAGAERFGDIHRGVPLMSATLLSRRLKQLEAEGIVRRERAASGRHWRYRLTEAGQDFVPMIGLLNDWGAKWSRRELEDGEVDLGLLLWGLDFTVDPAAFGPERSVVQLTFTDQPAGRATFWFVTEAGRHELCLADPGHPVDLYLSATLRDMIHLYRGDRALDRALGDGTLEAHGDARLRRRLADFLRFPPHRAARARNAA